jgi:hypothetical protein
MNKVYHCGDEFRGSGGAASREQHRSAVLLANPVKVKIGDEKLPQLEQLTDEIPARHFRSGGDLTALELAQRFSKRADGRGDQIADEIFNGWILR